MHIVMSWSTIVVTEEVSQGYLFQANEVILIFITYILILHLI